MQNGTWICILNTPPASSCQELRKKVEQGLEPHAGKRELQGKTVLLKPNYCDKLFYKSGAVTNPLLVRAVSGYFLDKGASAVIIAEGGSANLASTRPVFELNALNEWAGGNITLFDIKEGAFRACPLPDLKGLKQGMTEINISTVLDNADIIVNMPVMKTHILTGVTLGYKNLKGLISDNDKLIFHRNGLVLPILALNRIIRSHIMIMDGTIGMEGNGPLHGNPANKGVLLFSNNPEAAEIAAINVMGFRPADMEYIKLAADLKLMDSTTLTLKNIRFTGLSPAQAVREFKKPVFPDFSRFNIRLLAGDACSSCLNVIHACFANTMLSGAFRGYTITAGKTGKEELEDIPRSRILVFGDCQKKNSECGIFFSGCPPDFITVYDKLHKANPLINKIARAMQKNKGNNGTA